MENKNNPLRHWSFIIRSDSKGVKTWNPDILQGFYQQLYASAIVGSFACGEEIGTSSISENDDEDSSVGFNHHIQGYLSAQRPRKGDIKW